MIGKRPNEVDENGNMRKLDSSTFCSIFRAIKLSSILVDISTAHDFRPYGRLSKYFKDYFPIELVKTADLNPDGKYLLCSHPHGTIPAGINIATATNYCGWNEKFPGTY